MNNDNLAIALDRLKFYAQDAVVTLTQINGRSYKIEKLLGEGGFAFVYLIRDLSSGGLFALKKILITSGQEGVKEAMREVEAYRRFRHQNIIKIIDSAVVQDEGGEGKIIYLVRAMHQYHLPAVSASYPPTREEDPLVGEAVFDHDEELANAEEGELIPYAHRDIKPGPILMDFGSTIKARIQIETRQQALLEQSLGCTLFAVAYGHSPFEVDGTSIAMAVGSGRYKQPGGYSRSLVSLIDAMLVVDPEKRPDIQKVIDLTEQALRTV
ncbi:uncharacterized protein L201_004938 [Kwoniella dendrophila CBS 6074]|uniref:non-specific serine/threonine protein kinase n=1 Tax=Kwoniella dendrophila CBS 6074 TaxID=1295534 RepID=A0AAX4JYQ4_9TREE